MSRAPKARKKDTCEDATDFESDIIDDDCWNDSIRDIKDNPNNESEEKRHIKMRCLEIIQVIKT